MEQLTKVVVELLDGSPWADWVKSESLWAKPLGDDLYELRNSPFHAPALHFLDVVRAVPKAPGEMPLYVNVVRPSGHRTIRVLFNPEVAEGDRSEMLSSLNRWRAFYENGDGQFFAVNVQPEGEYRAVQDRLETWEREGKLVCDAGTTGNDNR